MENDDYLETVMNTTYKYKDAIPPVEEVFKKRIRRIKMMAVNPSKRSIEAAAQIWTLPEHEKKEMDILLCMDLARAIDSEIERVYQEVSDTLSMVIQERRKRI